MNKKKTQFENEIIQKIDQITIEEVYLWIILFLKFTFHILLIYKIQFQLNWRKIKMNELIKYLIWNIINCMGTQPLSSLQMSLLDNKS
jgi:hypothetical protein